VDEAIIDPVVELVDWIEEDVMDSSEEVI